MLAEFPLGDLVPYIDWSPFFHAWEIRGRRSVYALFVVEADVSAHSTAVPALWRDAVAGTVSTAALDGSLPHRGPAERDAIARAFLGATTWQAIVGAFRLPVSVLPDRVP